MAQKKIMRHASALKAKRQNAARKEINFATRSKVRNLTRKVLKAAEEKNKEVAVAAFKDAQSAWQKATKNHIFHKNAASRQISKMASRIAALAKS